MKIFQDYNVYEAAKERIRWIMDECDNNIMPCFSGGKDSTVIMELAIEVARERNCLPIKVLFIDQEAEWRHNIEYIRRTAKRPEVDMIWYQGELQISNGASHEETHLMCWRKGDKWMREKEPDSVHENTFGTLVFADLFGKIFDSVIEGKSGFMMSGLRAEESPSRSVTLTNSPMYKHVTYGRRNDRKKGQYTLYPLYDWRYTDIWKYIHDNDLDYCEIYNFQYNYGTQPANMRISSLHHETALNSLLHLQEIEPDTWEALQSRLDGVNTIKHMKKDGMRCPKVLPEAFESWREYRDYLMLNLATDSKRPVYAKQFAMMDERYAGMNSSYVMFREQITALIIDDYHMTKLSSFMTNPDVVKWWKWKTYGIEPVKRSKFFPPRKKAIAV